MRVKKAIIILPIVVAFLSSCNSDSKYIATNNSNGSNMGGGGGVNSDNLNSSKDDVNGMENDSNYSVYLIERKPDLDYTNNIIGWYTSLEFVGNKVSLEEAKKLIASKVNNIIENKGNYNESVDGVFFNSGKSDLTKEFVIFKRVYDIKANIHLPTPAPIIYPSGTVNYNEVK